MKLYRQGDIVLRKVSRLPRTSRAIGRKLKFRGETGREHVLEGEYKLYSSNHGRYILVMRESSLKHPEHGELKIAPGVYRIYRVRSFNLEESINVNRNILEEVTD